MIVTSWEAARVAILEQRGERLAGDVEALLRERELLAAPGSWAAAFCLDRGWPLPEEMLAARRRIKALETGVANAHCLLQEAVAAVDPEAFPELSARLFAALEPCELPQCQHVKELKARLAAVVALHPPSLRRSTFAENENMWCYECDTLWPCPTLQAAEGKP